MKKLFLIAIAGSLFSASAQELSLLKLQTLADYPSASAIAFHKDRFYVLGDDATSLIILDKDYKQVDKVLLFEGSAKRIAKDIKADFEAIDIYTHKGKDYFVAISSFSTPTRNKILISELPVKNKIKSINYSLVQREAKKRGIAELNFEGATIAGDKIIVSNRANTTNKTNHLLYTTFEGDDISRDVKIVPVELQVTKGIIGISGLAYDEEKDMLLFTASTEDTPNAYTDGAIGDSYLGYVSNISAKLGKGKIVPDNLQNISKKLKLKGDNKIESVTIESSTEKEMILHLVSDNDNGESTLFKVLWKW